MDVEIGSTVVGGRSEHGIADRDIICHALTLFKNMVRSFVEDGGKGFKVARCDFRAHGKNFTYVGTTIAGVSQKQEEFEVEGFV